MKHLPSCSDITACIDFCRDLHSLQTERIHGQALALTPFIWDDSLETVVPLSQSLLKSSHLWVTSKMNSGWRFLMSVNPKCQKPPPVLRVENTQPSLIRFCCNRRQFLIPVASSSDAGICPQSVPAPTYTFGLAELHARDALPTSFTRQHLINTPPVKLSQWLLFMCGSTELKKKNEQKWAECVPVSEFYHKNLSHRSQYLFLPLVSFSYKIDAMKIMLKNNHFTISVTHQYYQETLFSSIDSTGFPLTYFLPCIFFFFCSACHMVAAASYVLVITATKKMVQARSLRWKNQQTLVAFRQ